jgi:hypothetical protein
LPTSDSDFAAASLSTQVAPSGLVDFSIRKQENDIGADQGLALQAAADPDAAVVHDDPERPGCGGLERDEFLQGGGDLVAGVAILPPVGEERVPEVGVDGAAGPDQAGADELEPALEVGGGGLGADGVRVRGVADEIEHEQPAVAGVDLDGGGAGLGGGFGALLAAEGEGGVAELDLVAVAERDALLKAEAVVVGAVGAAEVGEEPAAAWRGLDHGVAAREAGLVEGERVGEPRPMVQAF